MAYEYLSAKARRAIKAYGVDACREAFRMHSKRGFGASGVSLEGPAVLRTTRQADAAINAGLELAEAEVLKVRCFTQEDGYIRFSVSGDEWRAEMPAVFGCYSLPVREYQERAILKKMAEVTSNKVLAWQWVSGRATT